MMLYGEKATDRRLPQVSEAIRTAFIGNTGARYVWNGADESIARRRTKDGDSTDGGYYSVDTVNPDSVTAYDFQQAEILGQRINGVLRGDTLRGGGILPYGGAEAVGAAVVVLWDEPEGEGLRQLGVSLVYVDSGRPHANSDLTIFIGEEARSALTTDVIDDLAKNPSQMVAVFSETFPKWEDFGKLKVNSKLVIMEVVDRFKPVIVDREPQTFALQEPAGRTAVAAATHFVNEGGAAPVGGDKRRRFASGLRKIFG